MSLIRYNPTAKATPWFDFDRFFAGFDRPFGTPATRPANDWAPAVDIYEDDKAITLTADLPGIEEKDLDVRVDDGTLTIKAERKFEDEEKKDNYHRVERRYGSFQRVFTLPETVDAEGIKANYDKGALKLTIPKVEVPSKERVIPIQ